MILVLIFGVSTSFAANVNQTDEIQKTTDDTGIVLSVNDGDTISSIKTNDSDEAVLLESVNNEKLSAISGTFTDLDKLIRSSEDELILDQDYIFSEGDNVLKISSNDFMIDFNGHILNANNMGGTVLEITGNNVVIKNMKFLNGNINAGNYPIKWTGDNGVFNNLSLSNSTGGIQWNGYNGHLTNSVCHNLNNNYVIYANGENFKFTNSVMKNINSAQIASITNGLVSHVKFDNIVTSTTGNYYFMTLSNTEISYCNFTNCIFPVGIGGGGCNASHLIFDNVVANNYRGIIMFSSGSIGSNLEHAIFRNCQVKNNEGSGRIVFLNNPSLKMNNCTMEGCYNTRYGISSASARITNCTFRDNNFVTYGVIVAERIDGTLIQNCKFINNTAPNGAAIYGTYVFVLENSEFINNTATTNGGAVFISKSKTTISTSTFINNNAKLGKSIYANNALNIKLNGTGNVWNESYESDVYAPNAYDEMYTHLYVTQDGTGIGIDPNDPTNFDNAINKITLYGTIEFINNNNVYTISKNINSPVNLKGNGITITTTGNVFTFGTCSNMYISGINFVNCGSTSVNAPIIYTGYGIRIFDCEFQNCIGRYAGAFYVTFNSGTVFIADVEFDNCKFIGNTASTSNSYNSGAISLASAGTNIISNCEFINNVGTHAGAIHTYGQISSYNIINCNFTGNNASNSVGGAAIRIATSSINIYNCKFEENSAPNGAIYVAANSFTLSYSNFTKNTATSGNGGAIFFANSAINYISDSKFNENSATSGNGGAIYTSIGVIVSNSEFYKNKASSSKGGAIYLANGAKDSIINGSKFNDNSALDGGAIYTIVKANIIDSNFSKNIATNDGGAIFLTVMSSIGNSKFNENNANNGGAIYASGDVSISVSEFTNNSATSGNGGAIYSNQVDIIDSKLSNNKATSGDGGAIYILDESIIRKSTFNGNNANNGGAIYVGGDNTLILTSILQNNKASNFGGAIYIKDGCAYYVDTESQQSYSGNTAISVVSNNIYNLYAKALIGEVYIIQNPNSVPSNNFNGSRDNPVNISTGLSKVAPGGKLIFICANEVYTAIDGQDNIITTNKEGIKLYGNNTIMEGFKFVATENGLEIHNFILTDCDDAVFTCYGSNCIVNNCIFRENGGVNCINASAVSMLGDNLTISNSQFINNVVGESNTEFGGAVFVNASNLNIVGCTFDGNVANYGAHIFVCENVIGVYIRNSRFSNANSVNFDGVGLLFKNNERITLSGNNFTDNIYGGALRFDNEVVGINIINNKFTNNRAVSSGHAVNGGAISISSSVNSHVGGNVFDSNSATSYGGAIYVGSGDLRVSNNDFKDNHANLGGAIYAGARLSVSDSNFTSNSAVNGGAIYSTAALSVSGSKFAGNSASGTGGAIYMAASGSSIQDSTFSGNTANSYRNVYSTSVSTFSGNTIDASYTLNSISDATYPADVTITGTFDDGNNFASNVRITANGDDATTFSLTNSNSFSASWEDVIPGNYNIAVANTDANNNKFVYTTTPARSFTVSRRNVIYVGNTAGSPGYGLTASDPTTWDHVAEILAEGGTVYFTSGTYSNFYDKTVSGSWTLRSVDGATVILDANNNGRIFTVSANNVKINGLTFKHGKVSNNQGSAIYWTGTGGSITNSVLTENTGTPISSSSTISISNSQMKNQITLSKSNINWGTTETIAGTFAHNAPSTVNILFNGTSQGSYSVASGKVTASYAFTNPATRSVGSYVVTDLKNNHKEVL